MSQPVLGRVAVLVSPQYNAPLESIDPQFHDDLADKIEVMRCLCREHPLPIFILMPFHPISPSC